MPQVLLSGANGSGKTSVLEAISMLLPGRGIRGGHLSDMVHRPYLQHSVTEQITNTSTHSPFSDESKKCAIHTLNAWQVDAVLTSTLNADDPYRIRCTYYLHRNQKETSLNGKVSYTATSIGDKLSVISLIPQMDFILLDAVSERRKLLDRIVYNFVKAHAHDISSYEQQLKTRLKLLKSGCIDNRWLEGVELNLTTLSVRITLRRLITATLLNTIIPTIPSDFAKFVIIVHGKVESLCCDLAQNFTTAVHNTVKDCCVEDILVLQYTADEYFSRILQLDEAFSTHYHKVVHTVQNHFAISRNKDSITGQSHYGVHKSDLILRDLDKNVSGKICSTGEQKSMLISLILAQTLLVLKQQNAQKKMEKRAIILLLDDVLQHLDSTKCTLFLEVIGKLPIQTWITGTDLSCYKQILNDCVSYNLNE